MSHYSGNGLSGGFLPTTGFLGAKGCVAYNLGILTWSVMVLVGNGRPNSRPLSLVSRSVRVRHGKIPATSGFSGSVYRLGCVDGYERSIVVVVDWLEEVWSSRKETGKKLV